MNQLFDFMMNHPITFLWRTVMCVMIIYIIYILLATIFVIGLGTYLKKSRSARSQRIRVWVSNRIFISDRMRKATEEDFARAGGKRQYKRTLKAAVAIANLTVSVQDAMEKRHNTCDKA